ncbi:MAG: glycosyl transferase [Chitinophagaceae bacterium]|nr:glycosyl transferase [Chitinophagaceae bacterium]
MKVAHILLVHKDPPQVARLIRSLCHPNVDCWVHVDKKSNIEDFRKVLAMKKVFLIQPRLRVDWGCFNTVDAMIFAMSTVLKAETKYDYVNFLSGQDYPLQPADTFLSFLEINTGSQLMGNRPLEESNENIIRFKKHYFNYYSSPVIRLSEKFINKVLPNRTFPYPHEIRKGSQWMALSRNAVSYILKFVADNPRYLNYFKTVHIPDEFFFQTILYNSPFKDTIRNPNLHYIDWSEGKKNPKLLTIEDYNKLVSSNLFFARKFDPKVNASILDALDERILHRANVSSEA